MILDKYCDLKEIRKIYSDIIYASGTFDIIHAGHVLFFEAAKELGDILVVSTPEDHAVRSIRGEGRPIQNQYLRSKMIDSLKPIGYCFINKIHELEELDIIFENLQPKIYVVNDDAFDIKEREKYTKRHNVELRILKRECPPEFDKITTSKIIERIKRFY